ncbi:MAG: radical SAM/SPASM domain-containing protein, partial [Candidatus Adiutrix sp.]
IDPTNRCNLSCTMCPRTYFIKNDIHSWNPKLELGDMDFSFYEKLIAEGLEWGLKSIKLNFLGEPLMYKRLSEMVEVASRAGLWVMLNTNATLLTKTQGEELLRAGLTDIFFSFDSPYPQRYEEIRLGASFKKTFNNIKNFMAIKEQLGKHHVQTRASMVLPAAISGEDISQIKADYTKLFRDIQVAEIGFGLPSVLGLDYEKTYGLVPGFVCPDIFRRMFVFWDGPVGPCCGDWERRLIMGNAKTQKVVDIWHGPAYEQLRKTHLKAYSQEPTCRGCSVPYLSTVNVA